MADQDATATPRRIAGPALVAAGGWVLLVLLVLANSFGVLAPDTKPEIYLAPARSLALWQSAWQENPQLGFPSFNIGLAPVAVVTTALSSVGLPAWLIMRVLRIALFTVGAFGAAALGRRVVGSPVGPVGLVAAVVYVANPYAVVAGETLPILWPYALLPWLVLFVYRAVADGRSWRWPAAAALAMVGMTGMNAGVVPTLQFVAVVPFALLARQQSAARWREVGIVAVKFGVLTLGMSLYWLVPALSALSAGQTVVSNSETVAGIAGVSSWSEVLRGLGLWPLYGADSFGPWLKGQSAYLTSPLLILASFGWFIAVSAAVALTRGRVRVWTFAGLILSAAVMVGLNPPDDPTPFGRALGWLLANVPGLSALRTTNKAGAAFILCAAVIVAAAVPVVRRMRPFGRRAAVVGSATVLVLASVAPVFFGAMYTNEMPVPDYWNAAAVDLDATGSADRVWFLPGEVRSHYRWSDPRPDELGNSLFTRPTLVRNVIPVSGAGAANLLAAVDSRLQNGALPAGVLSAAARRVGASDVLVRNDQVWELSAGAQPHVVQAQTDDDPGLSAHGTYGEVGQNTTPGKDADPADAALHPLAWYRVSNARGVVRALPSAARVLLIGDGAGFVDATAAGLIPTDAPLTEAAALSEGDLRAQAVSASRIVLTDSNRRSTQNPGLLTDGDSPLLPATSDVGSTRALGSAAQQTTLVVHGGSATASQVGSAFGALPNSAAENAVDGDPSTSWRFGDFNHAAGQWIDIRSVVPRDLSTVTVHTGPDSGVRIFRLRLDAAGRSTEALADDSGTVTLHLPGVRSDELRLTVLSTRGSGWNGVSISEVVVPGLLLTRVARVPAAPVSVVSAALEGGAATAGIPVDVLLRRILGRPADPGDDEETALRRIWDQPVPRGYRLSGVLRTSADLPEQLADRLSGMPAGVSATSTSHVSGDTRGSMAVDDDLATGWTPSALPNGSALTVTGPERDIDRVLVVQPDAPGPGEVSATRVRVEVDGRTVTESAVGPGSRTLRFRAVRGRDVRITVVQSGGFGRVRFLEAHDPGVQMTADPTRAARECVVAGYVDGLPIRAAFTAPPLGPGTHTAVPCPSHSSVSLATGTHELTPATTWTWDTLVLRDTSGSAVGNPQQVPAASSGPVTGQKIDVAARPAPVVLSIGQSYDSRWHASVDGMDLGAPVLADGWAVGWELPEGAAAVVQVTYGPERSARAALIASLVVLVLCVVLLVLPRTRRPARPLPPSRRAASPRVPPRWAWTVVVGGAWVLGGTVGLLSAVALVGLHAWWDPSPRRLLRAALVTLATMPFLFVLGNLVRFGQVTSDLVTMNPWPSVAAVIGLLLLTVGVARQEQLLPQGRMVRRDR